MPNAIDAVKLAIKLDCAQLKRKGNNLSELMSRNQATPSLPIFLKVPCKHQGRNRGKYSFFNFGSQRPSPYKVQLSVAGKPLEMEVDTGASLSVISEKHHYIFSAGQAYQLVESGIVLRKYTGEEVKPKGSCFVNRVFKIEERGRLEESHGRRGAGSNIRCSRSSAAEKVS